MFSYKKIFLVAWVVLNAVEEKLRTAEIGLIKFVLDKLIIIPRAVYCRFPKTCDTCCMQWILPF